MTLEHKYKFASVILAAGKGTRMKSSMPKVMHKLAGAPLITHVIDALTPLAPEKNVVVIAPHMDTQSGHGVSVKQAVLKKNSAITFAVQTEQLGTGHAVRCAAEALKGYGGRVLVLYGDTPLITTQTLCNLLDASESSEVVVLGMQMDDPTGYGRLIVDGNGKLEEIIEEKDASPEQKCVTLCNSGVMAISGKYLFDILAKLQPNNKAGEYYLTDAVAIANDMGLHASVVEADAAELSGINTRAQLAEAEYALQTRIRTAMMENGVTLIDPETVYFSTDTVIANDVTIHPSVVFGAGVVIESGAEIRSFSHIENATIKRCATIGPFARIRPGSVVGEGAYVGNFVELKNTTLGDGAKANHLAYVGDTQVGENANIGAGTITCNYDGKNKFKTTIGASAFIGSNSSLVAPVSIGAGAVVGAGSVITEDVPEAALALGRGRQVNKVKN